MNCTIDECEQPLRAKGMCIGHYGRWRRHGDPLGGRPSPAPGPCEIEGCEQVKLARGWCSLHYDRWLRNGDPLTVLPNPAMLPGDQNCKWLGNEAILDYRAVHRRLVIARGPAADHACADCGQPADSWSYDHGDPDEQVEAQGSKRLPFSTKPEHYLPRCDSCHWYADRPAYARTAA